jgi:spermidine synthase
VTEFSEEIVPGFRYVYHGELLLSERSPFQTIEVYEHASFGRMLVLDGLVQTTDRDEFVYHEMLVHVPLVAHPGPRSVLIVGGGDGGTLRHALMHPTVERAVMVEIDERVTEVCRKLMPELGGGAFDDPRADVRLEDGIAFVTTTSQRFDAILIDSSDPVGPGEGLFTRSLYESAALALAPGGVLAAQAGSPYVQQDELHRAFSNAASAFPELRLYLAGVPTYPGTAWSFFTNAPIVSAETARARARERGLQTRYWTPEVQRGSFDLPQIVRDVIAADGPPRTWGVSTGERERRAVP